MIQNMPLSLVSMLMPQPRSGGFDFASLYSGGSGASGGASFGAGSVAVALAQAERDEGRQLDMVRAQPAVERSLARYAKVVAEAETFEDVLDDPVAREVFLKANGLGDQTDYVGLVKKALTSDLADPDSLANKLAGSDGRWVDALNRYNIPVLSVHYLKISDTVKQISNDYVAEKRLDMLDEQLPGLGSAILFKRVAADFDSAIKILGSALGREVVTTALGIPKEIALQSLQAQEKAILQRLDPEKLQKPAYVDTLVQRYLIQLNGGASGVVA